MGEVWALTVSAADVNAQARAEIAHAMRESGTGIVLATCHRAELYGVCDTPSVRSIRALHGVAAVEHLMRVACGLESVIVGENEILHQVRDALGQSPGVDSRLRRLFEMAIAAGRRARSGRTTPSANLAQRAVKWLCERSDVDGRMVVVAGAGRMGAMLAHSLAQARAELVIASRDAGRAASLARIFAGHGTSLEAGAKLVLQATAVAVALGGQWVDLQAATDRALPPIADISSPQAVPDGVRRRINGNFLGIDDLYRTTRPLPGAYMKDAERLVAQSTVEYIAWLARPTRR